MHLYIPDTQSILLIYNIHFRLTRALLFKSSFHTKQKILLIMAVITLGSFFLLLSPSG